MTIREEWLNELESRFGEITYIHKIGCEDKAKPEIYVFFFENLPEESLTAITFGLSNANIPEWKYGKPELILTLDTNDKAWGLAMGYFVSSFFNERKFEYGSLFMMDEKISDESEMRGFFIFAPSFLSQDEATFSLADRTVHLSGMYPIYKEEVEVIKEIGLKEFWNHENFDMYNVKRKKINKREIIKF